MKSESIGRRELIRRLALAACGAGATLATTPGCERDDRREVSLPGAGRTASGDDLAGVIGITTGGFEVQRERGELTLENLPAFLSNELGLRLIDVNTRWLTSFGRTYVEACRDLAAGSGCRYTNVKVNHAFGDLYATDSAEAAAAFEQGRELVRVAHWLGARWIRFMLPEAQTRAGDLPRHRELADYAAGKDVTLVVENGGWMRSQADSVVAGVRAIGGSHPAVPAPDTGNWDPTLREEGLKLSFPGAQTCDFKVFDLDADGEHASYDLKRCFDIGWQAGYRGPWLLEHWNDDTSALVRELLLLRDQLRAWERDASGRPPPRSA